MLTTHRFQTGRKLPAPVRNPKKGIAELGHRALKAQFARRLPHDLHQAPGKSSCSSFRRGQAKRNNVTAKKAILIPQGVDIPSALLLDDGANERGIEIKAPRKLFRLLNEGLI
jgi:hypothetical protein